LEASYGPISSIPNSISCAVLTSKQGGYMAGLADRLPHLEQLGIDPRRQVGARLDPWRHEANLLGGEVAVLLRLLGADLELGQHASTPLSARRRISRWVGAVSR